MKLTLSIIKADIGSIGGHIAPSRQLLDAVKQHVAQHRAHTIIDHYISHQMPLMPVPLNTGTSHFDGPPLVSCAALSEHEGRFTEPLDAFAHPLSTTVRARAAEKALDMRRQGFFGAAMLPMSELEYTGTTEKLKVLDQAFRVRGCPTNREPR